VEGIRGKKEKRRNPIVFKKKLETYKKNRKRVQTKKPLVTGVPEKAIKSPGSGMKDVRRNSKCSKKREVLTEKRPMVGEERTLQPKGRRGKKLEKKGKLAIAVPKVAKKTGI